MGIPENGKIEDEDEGYVSYERVCLFLIKHVDSNLRFKKELSKRSLSAFYLGNNDYNVSLRSATSRQTRNFHYASVFCYFLIVTSLLSKAYSKPNHSFFDPENTRNTLWIENIC
ncbi:hypothetical protein BCT94_16775 [Vibrio breoganii]|nr:hypothetical protein BCT94_16775 [Vibrio breoganii]